MAFQTYRNSNTSDVLVIDMTIESCPGNQHLPTRCIREVQAHYTQNGDTTYIRIQDDDAIYVDDVRVYLSPQWTNQILYVKKTVLSHVVIGPEFVMHIYKDGRIYINLKSSYHGKVTTAVVITALSPKNGDLRFRKLSVVWAN